MIVCANSGRTTAQPPTVTDNNSSGVYVQIGTPRTKVTSADSVWVFARTILVPAASSTIFTSTQSGDSGGGLDVFNISGMVRTGANCIRQSGGQSNTAAATPSVVMSFAVLTANPCIGTVFNTTNSSTTTAPPASWTEATDLGYNTPASGLETCFRSSGETNTTIAFTGASASEFCSMIVELDINPIPIPYFTPMPQLLVQ